MNRDDHLAALGALADALDADALGRGVELREVIEELFVAGELVVVAGSEAEDVLGLGNCDRRAAGAKPYGPLREA
jgi:hypothetical protein